MTSELHQEKSQEPPKSSRREREEPPRRRGFSLLAERMGDVYDPEHPTESQHWQYGLLTPPSTSAAILQEGGGDTVVKEESLSKPTLLKNLPTKGLLSSRLLPKGTKSKVNLEEHGRQKVSFSFSQTKKPLPNLFLSQLSPEKSPCDLQLPLLSSNNSQQGKLELKVESRNESTGLSFPTPVPESPLSVTSLPKSKLELGKMHFKKQLLSVSASFEKPVDEPKPTIKLEEVSSLQETVLKPATKITTEAAVSQIQLTFKDCISEEHVIGVLEENLNPSVKGSTDSSHIGTEIKEKFSGLEQADIPEQHKSQSQSDSTLPGSESDGDSVRTSSSHKSGDPRSMAKTDNQNKDAKRNFSRVEESEKLEKSSSYAKSDERVKEERCSTHSKSDRETRYSRSSRSDKERRRTKSRSRSRSRGSRTSSSYSRSERSSRNERLSRSDRSHYHDSERRSYRSPYRERRSSRSRSDRKSRDSSDSEDDYRRARTGSNRSSNHSSSHRDSKFFYSKSEKDVKCSEISRSSETEKRIQLHSRSERCPRKIEFESIRKTSPELESECRKSNAHCKLESNIKSPLSKSNICSQTIDKKPHKGHSSSDSEDDQKEKSKFIKLPPCSGLNDSQPAMSEKDFKQSEQLNIKTEQQSGTLLKNKINLKKSRWDIVGQDKSDHEHSLKMPCHETKPSVKKIISVKKIEFSKDSGLEHVKNFGTIKMNLNNETVLSKQHSVGKNHASLEDNSLKSPQNQLDAKTQLSMSTQSQPCDTSNTNVDICFDQNYKEPPRSSHATSRSVAKDWTRDSKTGGHDVLLDKLERRNTSINQDVGSHSDDSDSEESDSDSDDCSIPKNRLHSVVVVPKNSTLTQPHDSRATLTSFSSPTGSPHQLPADWQEQGWRGSSSKESNRAHDAYSEVSGTLSPVERQKGFSSQLPESSKHTLHVLCTERPILTGQQNVTYQSQSNMVDSTSHVEASHTFEAQQSKEQKSSTYQNPKISVPSSSVGSFHSFETMWRTSDPGQSRPCDRPDSWHDRKSILMHQQHGEFSSSDDLSNKDGYRWGWDIPQPEQPSSTFQQPDSSYGIHTPNPMLVGSPALGQMGQHSSGCWIQPTASQGCRPVYLSVPSLYRESLDEMHPDSLTNDYEEESQENHGTVTFCNHPPPASTSFVQGPEISSNCRGLGGVLDTPREDSQKPHRGRGPPKKRRPEFESDSENEAESENSIKRERLAEPDVSRTSKDPVDTPNQTAEVERPSLSLQDFQDPVRWKDMAKLKKMPPYFDLIEENMYLTERKKNKSHRDIKRMQCECAVLSREERARGATACGEDCLNRLLMIECSSRCLNGSYCSNRRFQMKQHADFEVILTENKGWGLRAAKDLAPNTFVLEYCGEVLDHKEFKARWTVNGQLRVGFFTTKGVSAGTELTFDYQFQRYGKEAQKCLCGAPSCRGFLGGENRVSIRAAGGKMKKERSRKKDSVSALTTVDEELEALLENGEGLSDEKEVISLCRLMVRVETMEQKLTCLKLIQNTQNPGCLKQFLDHHGLSLLWIFMVELSEAKGNSSNNIKLQLEIMRSLEVLPISTKNMLEESRVLHFIQRWAQNQTLPQAPELDGYSSENTSRAQTPLNTPDGPPAKLGPELDGETPKRAVYRRLKIISENSLDSAMSDASKASDGKEEEEEEEEDEEEDSLPVDAVVSSHTKPSAQVEEEVSAPGLEKQEPAEVKEEAVETGQLDEERTKGQKGDVELAPDEERMEKDVGVEGAPGVTAPSESGQHSQNDETGPAPVKELSSPEVQEADTVASKGPAGSSEVAVLESVLEPDVGVSVCIAVETTVNTSTVMAETTESITTTQESAVEESAASTVENVGSVIATAETTTVGSASTTTEVPGSAVPTAEAAATASTTTATDPVAVGTPSQDEEEGVSDVESERSQEPPIRAVDISDMAARLLDSWKDLKEVYRIPKKSQVEKEPKERSRERDGPQSSRTPSGSRDRERDRERDRDRERERDRDLERTPRSTERRRRRSSHSPPLSAYERSSRRSDDRYEHPNSSKKKVRPKERNKLTTEERRKLFEQEVAQKEAQKQQQQQQQQQLQALPYEMLGYSPGPHGYMGYPPGYPIQTYVDPTNPNAGKVLLPTPSVEPLCAAGATVPYEQTPPQPLISELGLASPSSAPPSQTAPTAGVPHMATTLELAPGTAQYVQSRAPSQDSVTVLSAAPPTGGPQTQTQQGYTPVWSAAVPQPLTVQAQPAQPHTAIYYQGQACQAVYSIPTAYPQAGTPVIQTYAEPATGYIQGQPVYTAHQQGVVLQQAGTVTTIVTAPTVQQDLIAPNSLMDLPPPSPPKPKTIVLPPNWKVARDPEGKIYYYHVITRQTQWDPPCWEGGSDDASVGHEAEMDLGTPTYDENPSKFSTKTAEADTSSELAKKSKEVFRKEMSQFIVQCLNPYRKPDCKSGRISNTEDFKHLARKLTHGVMNKELKSCKNPEDLECNENVKHKTKEYIKKYMQKFGPVYRPKEDTEWVSDHRAALCWAAEGTCNIGTVNPCQSRAENAQGGALLRRPVRQQRVHGILSAAEHIQPLLFVPQLGCQLPPAPIPALLQQLLHLLLPVGRKVQRPVTLQHQPPFRVQEAKNTPVWSRGWLPLLSWLSCKLWESRKTPLSLCSFSPSGATPASPLRAFPSACFCLQDVQLGRMGSKPMLSTAEKLPSTFGTRGTQLTLQKKRPSCVKLLLLRTF
ncbi:histone-lysine N-methyltransferase SETD2-like [Scleropages formosus]|uniref:[histone H3]-lysine(36) N-trimethyltransferase n=1 Tax=Scleropages formosus TaxID=113540 RepID=A0A0P7XM54_SCLFO|nr:histone-lysine N-methyltransferase SETD2-like [Scleropages formosus]